MAPSLTKNALEVIDSVDGDHSPLSITLQGSNFLANGHPILTHVPANIISTPSPSVFSPNKPKNTVGCFVGFDVDNPKSRHVVPIGKLDGIRFMSLFRFKVWWTTQWVGNSGKDVENETQMMILDKNDSGRPYVLLLPLIEGPFRASLQPAGGALNDNFVDMCVESGSTRVCGSCFRSCLYMHVGEDPFTLVKEAMKVIRVHLGTFKLLEEKTVPAIVDKFGWCTWDAFYLKVHPQGVWEGVKGLVDCGCPPGMVLIDDGWQSICHDEDPLDQEGMNRTAAGEQMPCRLTRFEENYKFRDYVSPKGSGMGGFIRDLKEEFKSVENVYVWHALCGYWGGVRPNVAGLVGSTVVSPKLSPGLLTTMEDLAVERIVKNGVGLVPPESVHEMYEELHSHLESAGIDGVKVDVIHLLEMLSEEFGGRVELAKAYYKALTASVRKHFKGNGVIASMEHCNDFMYLGTETISLGRVGVVGVFNCQGGGWCPVSRRNQSAYKFSHSVACWTGPKDVEWNTGKNPIVTKGVNVFALYFYQEKKLRLLKFTETLEVSLEPFNYELLTVSPATVLLRRFVQFAPIGLVNMLNSGGAIQSIEFGDDDKSVKVGVKGHGEFRVFASEKPITCKLDGMDVGFDYSDQMVSIQIPWPATSRLSMVEYLF
ncbi:hypothetical protein HS088_TW19G00476 [Tripterygium wilfordii]|uniref:galactinol--sucrose galactosyltransferase n=1 Tax=Tripterygium wilfordii TaxID=458696 RepID=A0A7J7C9N6_TRIWF|nr:hypothetical protein HS088_TW19G00476 [Tripterygium wilfordii]